MRFIAKGDTIWDTVNACVYGKCGNPLIAIEQADLFNAGTMRKREEKFGRLAGGIGTRQNYPGFKPQNMMYPGSGI